MFLASSDRDSQINPKADEQSSGAEQRTEQAGPGKIRCPGCWVGGFFLALLGFIVWVLATAMNNWDPLWRWR